MPVSCLENIIEIPDDKLSFSSSSQYLFSGEATQTKGNKTTRTDRRVSGNIHIQYGLLVGGFLVAQAVKNLLALQETQVRSLGWEDALEKEMAAHSSNLAWKILWTEEPDRLQSKSSKRVGHD